MFLPTMTTTEGVVIPNEFQFGTWNDQPLTWRVLRLDGTNALAITRATFAPMAFHSQPQQASWETSNVRSWMNGAFLKGFAAEELAAIVPQTLETPGSDEFGTEGCAPTEDRAFCLSLSEADELFASASTRNADGDNPSWWLRSPGGLPEYAAYVHNDGWVNAFGFNVDEPNVCVRPAAVIDLTAFGLTDQPLLASDYGMELMLEALDTNDFSPMKAVIEQFGMDESWESLVAESLQMQAEEGDAQAIEGLFDIFGDIEFGSAALAAAFATGHVSVARLLMRRGYSLDGKLHSPKLVNDTPGLKRDRKAAYHAEHANLAGEALSGDESEHTVLLLIRQESLPREEYRLLLRAAAKLRDESDTFDRMLNPDHNPVPGMGARWSNRKVMVLAHAGKHDLPISQQAIRLLWHEGMAKDDPLSVKSMALQLADPTIHDRQALLNCLVENGWSRELHELLNVKRMFTPKMLTEGVRLAQENGQKEIAGMLADLVKSVGAGKLLQ